MLQELSVENFRSIGSARFSELGTPAVIGTEQGIDPDDLRDSIFLAARSFPGGREGSHLLNGSGDSEGTIAKHAREGTSFRSPFAEHTREDASNGRLFAECTRTGTPFCRPFTECARNHGSYISMSFTWVLENPENEILPGFSDKKRSGAVEFREICRLFGERFGVVRRIILKNEVTYESRPNSEAGNVLSYQMLEITVDRAFAAPLTGFYELVVYPGGTNYDLYWDTLPDVHRNPVTGRAKGCNVRMSGLEIRNIVSDGVQDGADFDMILPTIMRLSEYPGRMFRDLVYAEAVDLRRKVSCTESSEEEAGERARGADRRYDHGCTESSKVSAGERAAGKRIPWISPDGKLVHSLPGGAVGVWLSYINASDGSAPGLSESGDPKQNEDAAYASRERRSAAEVSESRDGKECGQKSTEDVPAGFSAGLLTALLAAPVGGTVLLKAPLSTCESAVRERFLECAAAQAELEKSVLIMDVI
ncbi:MAG: hypothetical protein J6D46_03425 [Lachnospiraceae bacterium]|nr:hypothetical protein [Lachnospiraceae bacterium]